MDAPRPRRSLGFDAALWREVGLSPRLEDSVQGLAFVLGRHLPVEHLLLIRYDDDGARVRTLISVPCAPRSTVHLEAEDERSSVALARELGAWLESRWPSRQAGDLDVPAALPAAIAVRTRLQPLGSDAVLVLICAPGVALDVEHFALVEQAIEPFSAALGNADRHELLVQARASGGVIDEREDEVIIGRRGGLRAVMEQVELVAPTGAPVLLVGEPGSGRERVARAIHRRSPRASRPFVRINCGVIPPARVDAELFGEETAAGEAAGRRPSVFERIDGGTVMLDEIELLPMSTQLRLVRLLRAGVLQRVGALLPTYVDVRVIATARKQLRGLVTSGELREDLWYALSTITMRLPPLRQRLEDLPALATHFAAITLRKMGAEPVELTSADVELLRAHAWSGNLRELATVIERAAILGGGKRLDLARALELRPHAPRPADTDERDSHFKTIDEVVREHILRALAETHGRLDGSDGTAARLGTNPQALRARMRKLGIPWR